MKAFQRAFLEFAIDCGVLRFGDFVLKSGRRSPYFFNTGLCGTGTRLGRLGRFYAEAILDSGLTFDMLFGPAYKGIPLVAAAAVALAEHFGRDVPFCFNRKESKNYAEGGDLIGAPLIGRVLIIDDVISAGLSVDESVERIQAAGARPAGVFVALDRQERSADGEAAAAAAVERRHGIPVRSIVTLQTLLDYLERHDRAPEHVAAIRAYRARYGAAT